MNLSYSKDYIVTYSYIDNRGISRPSAIVDFMQDAATVHEKNLSILKGSGFWVLSKLKYSLKRPLLPYETVTVKTWCGAIKGAIWYRNFSFSVNDEFLGTGVTAWVILDEKTHKIMRPTSIAGYESLLPEDNIVTERLDKIEKHDSNYTESHIVSYSDIDINNHLNNVKIVDIIGNAVNLHEYKKEFISELQVNYLGESKVSDKLSIDVTKKDKELYIYAKKAKKEEKKEEEEKRFEAKALLSEI